MLLQELAFLNADSSSPPGSRPSRLLSAVSLALSPELRSGLPRLPRSSFSCAVESWRSEAAPVSAFSERFPPVSDWPADLSESVHVLIAEHTPSAQSCALSVLLLPPPPPPHPAASTTSRRSDAMTAGTFILPEATAGAG